MSDVWLLLGSIVAAVVLNVVGRRWLRELRDLRDGVSDVAWPIQQNKA